MLLEDSNRIEFQTAFTFDGTFITTHDDPVPSVELLRDGALEYEFPGWGSLGGHSGQHGYEGPVMHESEQFSPNVLQALVERWGDRTTFALTTVEAYDEEFDDTELCGWAILIQLHS